MLFCDGWKVKLAVGASANAAGLGRTWLKGRHFGVFLLGGLTEDQICVETDGELGMDA